MARQLYEDRDLVPASIGKKGIALTIIGTPILAIGCDGYPHDLLMISSL